MKSAIIIAKLIATLLTSAFGIMSAHACAEHFPDEPVSIYTPKCVPAKPKKQLPPRDLKALKKQSAEVKRMRIINATKAKLVLDFVEVFDVGKEEYQRYLKLGYPKISQEAFDEKAPGGLHVVNHNKKLRTFYTSENTVFKAHCMNSPTTDHDGQVILSAKEFNMVLNKDNGTDAEWQAFKQKHNGCYSQGSDLVRLTYVGDKIASIEFHWTP